MAVTVKQRYGPVLLDLSRAIGSQNMSAASLPYPTYTETGADRCVVSKDIIPYSAQHNSLISFFVSPA